MAGTLLLDRDTWDICADALGNIALATEPYSQSQDVASECRVYRGECYYDTTRGIPYPSQILGQMQPVQVLKESLASAAALVPGVTDVKVFLTAINAREIGGQVQFQQGVTVL
ncbi:hypothetical protein LTR94_032651, partial [Friedmanniomyces endolithicus]